MPFLTPNGFFGNDADIGTPITILGANLISWYRADQGTYTDSTFTAAVTTNGTAVGGWKDLSPNAYHISGTSKPTLATNVLNTSYPALNFSNPNLLNIASYGSTYTKPIVYAVCRPGTLSAINPALFSNVGVLTSTACIYLNSTSGYDWYIFQNTNTDGGTPPLTNTWYVISCNFNGGNFTINGNIQTAVGSFGSFTGLQVGFNSNFGGWLGYIAEIIVVQNTATAGQLTQLANYIRNWTIIY